MQVLADDGGTETSQKSVRVRRRHVGARKKDKVCREKQRIRSLHLLEEPRWFRRRLKAEKTSGAARVSFVRDIRLLVGKMPASYYGLF